MQRFPLLVLAMLTLVGVPRGEGIAQEQKKPTRESRRLLVDISSQLIDAAVHQSVDRTEPFFEIINEIPVTGTQRTVGKVGAELVPDPCRGIVDITFDGTVYSCGVGHRLFTFTYTYTCAPFSIRQRVVLSPASIAATRGPGAAWAAITLLGVTNREGDPEGTAAHIVRLGFPQQKEELEAIVSRIIACRLHERLESDAAPGLTRVSKAIGSGVLALKNIDLPVESLEFQTSSTYMQGRLAVTPPSSVTVQPAPAIRSQDDAAIRIHESLLSQAATVGLGGKTIQLTDVRKRASELAELLVRDGRDAGERKSALDTVEGLLKGPTGKSASFTLAKNDPLRFRFTSRGIEIEGHISSFSLPSGNYAGVKVRANYEFRDTPRGRELVRNGPITYEETDEPGKKLPPLDSARRALVEAVFNEVLVSRLALSELTLPGTLERVCPLVLSRADAADGWLSVAWRCGKGK